MIVIGSSLLIRESPDSSQKVYKRGGKAIIMETEEKAEEGKAAMEKVQRPKGSGDEVPVYTFEDVHYTVQVAGKDKPLLVSILSPKWLKELFPMTRTERYQRLR